MTYIEDTVPEPTDACEAEVINAWDKPRLEAEARGEEWPQYGKDFQPATTLEMRDEDYLNIRTNTSCRECRAGEHEVCDTQEMRFCTCRMEEHKLPVRPNPARAMRGSLAAVEATDAPS